MAVTFDYGQRHAIELQAAATVAWLAGVKLHETVRVGALLSGTSPLTNPQEPLEQYTDFASMDAIIGDRVEKTFVPMRNALFLTLAANRAAVWGSTELVTGVCQADNANYPDCRQSFIDAMRRTINEALGYGDQWKMDIHTPLMDLTKKQSIGLALSLPGAYTALAYSHTAYDGQFPPTGNDHATILRAHGFEEAGLPDPLVLRAVVMGLMKKPDTSNYSAEKMEWATRRIWHEAEGLPADMLQSWRAGK